MEIIFSRLYYEGEDLQSNRKIFDKAFGIALKVMNTRYWKELIELLSLWEKERLVIQFENRSEINSRHEEMFNKIRVDCIAQLNTTDSSCFQRTTIPVQPSQADDARKQETCNRKRSFEWNDVDSTPPKQGNRGPFHVATQFSTCKTPNVPIPSTSTLCRKTLF